MAEADAITGMASADKVSRFVWLYSLLKPRVQLLLILIGLLIWFAWQNSKFRERDEITSDADITRLRDDRLAEIKRAEVERLETIKVMQMGFVEIERHGRDTLQSQLKELQSQIITIKVTLESLQTEIRQLRTLIKPPVSDLASPIIRPIPKIQEGS
jgi:hypothetical protein